MLSQRQNVELEHQLQGQERVVCGQSAEEEQVFCGAEQRGHLVRVDGLSVSVQLGSCQSRQCVVLRLDQFLGGVVRVTNKATNGDLSLSVVRFSLVVDTSLLQERHTEKIN